MKKMILSLASALVLSSFAKPEKFCDVTIADSTKLVNAATQIGGFVGEPMLGMMASGMLSANPMLATLGVGPLRPGAPSHIVVYLDDKKNADLFSDGVAVLLYPTQVTKAECLAALEGAKEVDGAIHPAGMDNMALVFADDVKYVAITGGEKLNVQLARKSLAALSKMPKLGKVEVLKARLTKFGVQTVAEMAEASRKEIEDSGKVKIQSEEIELLKQIEAIAIAVGVSQRGLDFDCKYFCREGSEISKMGSFMKNSSPLAFAGKDALLAMAWGENSQGPNVQKQWNELAKILKKWGFELKGVKYVQEGSAAKFTVDLPAMVKYLTGDAQKSLKRFEKDASGEEFFVDILNFVAKEKEFSSEKAGSIAFYIKGVSMPATAQERFAKLMPEYAREPSISAGVFSYYSIIKSCAPQVWDVIDADKAKVAMLKGYFESLPAANDADIAFVWTKKGKLHSFTARISPAEVNGLAKLCSSCMALSHSEVGCDEEADDDDSDGDDLSK